MENNVKRDNRKALPKYLMVLLASGLVGGVLGVASGLAESSGIGESALEMLNGLMMAAAPWTIPVTSVVSLGLIWWLYRGAKGLYTGWDGEDEDVMDQVDEKLNWALLVTTAQMVLDMFFFAAVTLYGQGLAPIVGVLVFMASIGLLIVAQQKIVDLTRRMNPEKKGSVYDMNFKKKWFESCDEAEQKQIGQAAYKAYGAMNVAFPTMWMVTIFLNFVFDIGLLPVFTVSVLWLVMNVSYCLECIRQGKRKGGTV